jgi:5-methylcytosine-specific restriction protein B
MLGAKRDEFRELFADFVTEYLESPDGQRHVAEYESQRAEGRRNLNQIVARRAAGQDVTNDVLLKLLPYADTSANRQSGAWVHASHLSKATSGYGSRIRAGQSQRTGRKW